MGMLTRSLRGGLIRPNRKFRNKWVTDDKRLGQHPGPMTTIVFLFVFHIFDLTPVAAAESSSSALAPVTTFFADYDKHDIQTACALFDQELSVTDAFPPGAGKTRSANGCRTSIVTTPATDIQTLTSRLANRSRTRSKVSTLVASCLLCSTSDTMAGLNASMGWSTRYYRGAETPGR